MFPSPCVPWASDIVCKGSSAEPPCVTCGRDDWHPNSRCVPARAKLDVLLCLATHSAETFQDSRGRASVVGSSVILK
jgi:hypothetical protein